MCSKQPVAYSKNLRNNIINFTVAVTCIDNFLLLPEKVKKMTSLMSVIPKLYQEYTTKTPKKLKIIDAYLLYVFLTAVIQFVYCCLVGTFPFNSFLSGFISTVSSFVLGGSYTFALIVSLVTILIPQVLCGPSFVKNNLSQIVPVLNVVRKLKHHSYHVKFMV
jgi:hypothetical protein